MILKIISIMCLSFLLLMGILALDDEKQEDYLPSTGIIFILVVFMPLLYIILN